MKKTTRWISILTALLLGASAQAAIIEMKFEGLVSDSSEPLISVGDIFTYYLMFDDASPDTDPDPTMGSYGAGILSAKAFINGALWFDFNAIENDAILEKEDGFGGVRDRYYTLIAQIDSYDPVYSTRVFLNFFDSSQTAHSDDVMAGFLPDPGAYSDGAWFNLGRTDGDIREAVGGITSVSVVPEPATAGLLTISGLILFGIRRLKKTYGIR